jgi:hypothetical protein
MPTWAARLIRRSAAGSDIAGREIGVFVLEPR